MTMPYGLYFIIALTLLCSLINQKLISLGIIFSPIYLTKQEIMSALLPLTMLTIYSSWLHILPIWKHACWWQIGLAQLAHCPLSDKNRCEISHSYHLWVGIFYRFSIDLFYEHCNFARNIAESLTFIACYSFSNFKRDCAYLLTKHLYVETNVSNT